MIRGPMLFHLTCERIVLVMHGSISRQLFNIYYITVEVK